MADLEVWHDFATDLAVRAGALLCQSAYARSQSGYGPSPAEVRRSDASVDEQEQERNLDMKDKESSVDVVTEADVRVEQFILGEIRKRFPSHRILAEETYAAGGSKVFDLTDEPTWIVDPLDGTVNYVHLFPLICVSIGITVNKKPVVGAIYAPLLGGFDPRTSHGTLWSSCQGRGAYQSNPSLNASAPTTRLAYLEQHARSPMSANAKPATRPPTTDTDSQPAPPEQARPLRLPLGPLRPLSAENPPKGLLIASEWGKARSDHPTSNLMRKANTFLNLASEKGGREGRGMQVQGIRSLGSAALDLAWCASGSVDVFWEGGCWEWDVCAGMAILYEAGGLSTDANAPPAESPLWKDDAALPPASLGARRFLCIRPCAPDEQDHGDASISQQRVARAIWRALHLDGLDYQREGVDYPT